MLSISWIDLAGNNLQYMIAEWNRFGYPRKGTMFIIKRTNPSIFYAFDFYGLPFNSTPFTGWSSVSIDFTARSGTIANNDDVIIQFSYGGPTGERGPQGFVGQTGPTGPQGRTGDRGQTGANGLPGDPGPSSGVQLNRVADGTSAIFGATFSVSLNPLDGGTVFTIIFNNGSFRSSVALVAGDYIDASSPDSHISFEVLSSFDTGTGQQIVQARSIQGNFSLFFNRHGFTVSKRGITGASGSGVLAGMIMPYAGSSLPEGWLWCDGSNISKVTYATLFAAIGTTYGATQANFNLPDLRGRVVAGLDSMNNSVGTGGGAALRLTNPLDGSVLGANGGTEAHSHAISRTSATNTETGPGGDPRVTSVTTPTSGGSSIQPTLILNYIIKT
jgi:microcystin-dependent protein